MAVMVYNVAMRSQEEWLLVHTLHRGGKNNCQIARETGLPRGTVRDWVKKIRAGVDQLAEPTRSRRVKCGFESHRLYWSQRQEQAYSYILGMYLGDGLVTRLPRTWRMRIFLTASQTKIWQRVVKALQILFPNNKINVRRQPKWNCTVVSCYSLHWPCILPQVGPGKKNTRDVSLVDWQRKLVVENLEDFVTGLFHSDGCLDNNKVDGIVYPRYTFCNTSSDIIKDLIWALELLGIDHKIVKKTKRKEHHTQAIVVSVARRDMFEKLKSIIGDKT